MARAVALRHRALIAHRVHALRCGSAVVVSENKGTGVRVFASGSSEPVAFVREHGQWRIQIFARA